MNAQQSLYLERLAKFNALNLSEIEEYLGEGQNHLVYKYKKKWVLKIPKINGSSTYSDSKALKADLELIRLYFPELMVTTKVLVSQDSNEYIVLQKFCKDSQEISGEITHTVRKQLEAIIKQNKRLFRETGRSLDLFGSSGFVTSLLAIVFPRVKPKLSNILLKKKSNRARLSLVDTELLRLSRMSKSWSSIRFFIRSWVSYRLTSFLLRRAFNFASA